MRPIETGSRRRMAKLLTSRVMPYKCEPDGSPLRTHGRCLQSWCEDPLLAPLCAYGFALCPSDLRLMEPGHRDAPTPAGTPPDGRDRGWSLRPDAFLCAPCPGHLARAGIHPTPIFECASPWRRMVENRFLTPGCHRERGGTGQGRRG